MEDEKGIDKFEHFLKNQGFPHAESVIEFMRNLQKLRSSGVAHRKGREYEKSLSRLGLSKHRRQEAMKHILEQAVATLRLLKKFFLEERK